MANEAVGTVQHQCGNVADVRKNKKGRLYMACPNCGLLMMAMQGGQEWILDNMQPLAAPPPPQPQPDNQAPEPPKGAEPAKRERREVAAAESSAAAQRKAPEPPPAPAKKSNGWRPLI